MKTGELSNLKEAGTPRKTSTAHDSYRIIIMMKNYLTDQKHSSGASRGSIGGYFTDATARCNPVVSFKNRMVRLQHAKNYLKVPAEFWNKRCCGQRRPKLTCIRVMARGKCAGQKELPEIQCTPLHL